MSNGWIGFDLDKTLATYSGADMRRNGRTWIGAPILSVVEKAKAYRSAGFVVKIFTARAHGNDREVIAAIKAWTKQHIGAELEVTCTKDPGMLLLFDDKAVQVLPNAGIFLGNEEAALQG